MGMMSAAVLFLTAMNAAIKIIGPDYHPAQVAFVRNLIAAVVIVPFILKSGGGRVLRTRRPWAHAARSLGGVIGNILFFYSFVRLPLVEVMVISQAVPVIVALLAAMILKEKVGWRRWGAIVTGFIGVIVTIDPVGSVEPATWAAVGGTALWAGTILMMRSLGRTESPYAVAFYYMVTGTIMTAALQPWIWQY